MTTTKPAFDLDAWLADANLPEGEVVIYGKAHLMADIDAIDKQLETSDDSRTEERLVKQRAKLIDELKASALTIRLRALTDKQRRDIEVNYPRPGVGANLSEISEWDMVYNPTVISQMAIEPKMTVEQVQALRERVTETTFESILVVCHSVNSAVVRDAPFWRRSSQIHQG